MYVLEKPVFLEFERIEGEGDFSVNRRVNLIVVCAGITIMNSNCSLRRSGPFCDRVFLRNS